MNYLDLSQRKLKLEKIFGSIINKIPDLCHPAAIRLENETDHFNQTKELKLVPFRSQDVFERCVTPTQDERRHEAVSSPTGECVGVASPLGAPGRPQSSSPSLRPTPSASPSTRNDSPILGRVVQWSKSRNVAFSSSTQTTGRRDRQTPRGELRNRPSSSESRMSAQQQAARDRYRQKNDLNRKYSHLKLRKSTNSPEIQWAESVDKIFISQPATTGGGHYPFANPMPDCMLTRDNIDNLRDIIVSSLDIGWRMLTPVRPASDYEENYFDRLIQLHRKRYRHQQAEALRGNNSASVSILHPLPAGQQVPFKHTRHSVLIQNPSQQFVMATGERGQRHQRNCLCLGVRLKDRFVTRRSRIKSLGYPALNIPTLMLTADDTTSSELLGGSSGRIGANDEGEEERAGTDRKRRDSSTSSGLTASPATNRLVGDEADQFSYKHYSRFSRRNQQFARNELAKAATSGAQQGTAAASATQITAPMVQVQQQPNQTATGDDDEFDGGGDGGGPLGAAWRGETVLDGQIEDIISNLLNV